ncbi:alpha/beta hydrolase [Phenylobacterium montanum]|uniref:Alpha/beta hydrolase n=2 Tax=Phenylobacterium montanum TaxID=2823693 RepID=A0A975G4U7_9CAUL|nr:alpha/beta hydrolase [Caulobacter sp. S6]
MPDIRTGQLAANSLSFAYDEAGEGDDVALLLHGFPECRFSWRHQLEPLAALGWRAVAPDLRGYGGSSKPAGKAAYRMERLIEDVAAMFDALGARRRLLIGHDWGALIAWAFAIERLRPLDGLVVMNVPHPAVYIEHMRSGWRQRAKSWYVGMFQIPWLPEAMLTAAGGQQVGRTFANTTANPAAFPPEVLDHYRRNAIIPGAMTAMVNYYRANTLSLPQWGPGRARRIEVPTLLVWGEKDPFVGVELSEGYGPYVRDLTLERLPHASHWVQQDDPDGVNARLKAWMTAKGLSG